MRKRCRFTKQLTHLHFNDRLNIPHEFMTDTGIATRGNSIVVLRDERGREWSVSITHRNMRRYALSAGFKDFLKANHLAIGNAVRFEFLRGSNNVIKATALRHLSTFVVPPSFFKVLINANFNLQLKLPPVFVRKYKAVLSDNMKLRMCPPGTLWDVKVEQMEDHHFFTLGWDKFTHDMNIQHLDFLVFRYFGNSIFDVTVFDCNGCIREQLAGVDNVKIEEEEEEEKSNNPRIEIFLQPYMRSKVTLLKRFADAAGLWGKQRVRLEYHPGGHFKEVALYVRLMGQASILSLAAGWSGFRSANELVFGKRYTFEYIPCKQVIEVKQAKEEVT